jgi:thioredoxin-related protein
MKITLTTLLAFLPIFSAAQNFSNLNFEQAKSVAEKEKKIILVDVTSKRMVNDQKFKSEKLLASDKGVADFSSNNLVAIRIDMETQEGKEFAPLLQMNMYPTYAFMMPNGDLLGVIHPSRIYNNPTLFLEIANEALSKAKEKWANSRKINFMDISFEDALKLSKSSGKPVFIDAYTDNCQPCMRMVKDVFSLDKVADFYNEHFICLSMNLGTVHTDLAKRYGTIGYPSYLFLNSNGDLIYSASGFTDAETFISYGDSALNKFCIRFEKGSWNDVMNKAFKDNKPVFLDCFTTWCGPCRQMNNEVFTQPEVAEYFNSNFINAKFDMEKGEGIELKNRFEVNAFPTYVFIDPSGNVVNKIVGSMPANEFIALAKEGMEGNGLSAMQKKYALGERSEEFLLKYLNTLEIANLRKEANEVAQEFFKISEPSNFKNNKKYFTYFISYMEDVDSELFKYIYKNRFELYNLYPKDVVDRKLRSVWENGATKFINGEGAGAVIDLKGFKEYVKRMKNEGVEDYQTIEEKANIYYAIQSQNWKRTLSLIDAKINKNGLANIQVTELLGWGMQIDKKCQDIKIRKHAAGWFEKYLPIFEAQEAQRKSEAAKKGVMLAMSMVNYPEEMKKLYKSLSGN